MNTALNRLQLLPSPLAITSLNFKEPIEPVLVIWPVFLTSQLWQWTHRKGDRAYLF